LKSMVTCCSSNALTTPGSSALAASLKMISRPSDSSMSWNWLRGITCTFCGLGWPKAFSGSICRLRLSPALKPYSAVSKPGSRLPSPTLKVAGCLSKVLSTTSPLASLRAKCRVTSLSGPIRCSVMGGFSGLLALEHVQRQHHGADGDTAVGQVEGRKAVLVLPVDQDEVDHMTEHHPVVQVAQRATQHQRQGDGQPGFVTLQAFPPHHQHSADAERDGREEPALPAGLAGQEAEGRTAVVD